MRTQPTAISTHLRQMFKEDAESVKFLSDETVKSKLATAKKLSTVSAKDYDAVFYVGGHAPVIDLPSLAENIKLASEVQPYKGLVVRILTQL